MCFSATASFGSGILLSAVGAASLKKTKSPEQVPFASIPIIFGVQQLAEGFVWLSLSNAQFAQFQQAATYVFLLIAQAVWPILIPFAFWKMETDLTRKRILAGLTGLGCIVVAVVLSILFSHTVTADIHAHHVKYHVIAPASVKFLGGVPYFLSIVVSPFVSSIPRMKWLGWGTLGAFIFAKIFFAQYLVSVWCFFAALVSIGVYLILVKQVPARQTIAAR